jgi:hypothetical protein
MSRHRMRSLARNVRAIRSEPRGNALVDAKTSIDRRLKGADWRGLRAAPAVEFVVVDPRAKSVLPRTVSDQSENDG